MKSVGQVLNLPGAGQVENLPYAFLRSSMLKVAQKAGYALVLIDEVQVDMDGYELDCELGAYDMSIAILLYCCTVAQQKARLVTQNRAQRGARKLVDSYGWLSAAHWMSNQTAYQTRGT